MEVVLCGQVHCCQDLIHPVGNLTWRQSSLFQGEANFSGNAEGEEMCIGILRDKANMPRDLSYSQCLQWASVQGEAASARFQQTEEAACQSGFARTILP